MIRTIKVLASAVIAVLTVGAISASEASATEFHSGVLSTNYKATGDGSQVFTTPAGTISCTGVSWEAKTSKQTNPSLTATNIKYSGAGAEGKCITKTIFGNINVSINFTTDECDYVLHAFGAVDIECAKAGGITINGPGCSITVPTQTERSTVHYDNWEFGTKRDFTQTAFVTGIKGTATGFLCSKEGSFTSGEYIGNVTVQGFSGSTGLQEGIWVE